MSLLPGRTVRLLPALLAVLALPVHAAEPLLIEFNASATNLVLRSRDARQQLLATRPLANNSSRDLTREVLWSSTPAGIVSVDPTGRVSPVADGEAVIEARARDGAVARLPVRVSESGRTAPLHFANQIVPIFTKNGCNSGGCHGKASGQNGFRLSLLGFEPAEDYDHLVNEARGRRLSPAAPQNSLLLQKGSAALPHGGGNRLDPESDDYRMLVRWIAQGMPAGAPDAPTVERIEVIPSRRTLARQSEQQLVVLAHYSDGSVEDVTRGSLFEANDKDMARVSEHGLVKLSDQPGDVAIMVRYQARVGVCRATVPLGAPVDTLPLARGFVDELVFAKLRQLGLPPSELCDDNTFLRRVTVDIAGRLPTPAETRTFLADSAPDKRDRWIDRLLESAEYADLFANKWSALLRNRRTEPRQAPGAFAFHGWIRDSLMVNKPFDQFVREILAASGEVSENPPAAWYRQVRGTQQQLEDTAQLLLGVRLQCAQCHHHPYEKWSQQDYSRFGAFFSQVGRKNSGPGGDEYVFARRSDPGMTNKKTRQNEKPAGLGAEPAPLTADDDARLALATWMTDPKNPFFARSLVNRYWKHFFNRGIVDPEDDMRDTNPPTNPELLEALTRHFVASEYDLKDLVRTLCRSTTYQLSSVPNQYNHVDRQHFSRYYPKRLTAEVLYDSLNQVVKAESAFEGVPAGTPAVCLPDNSFNASSYFLTVFGRPESSSACECERGQDASLAQSLHLLNAKDLQSRIAADSGRAALLAADSARSEDDRLRELYLWTFSREPTPAELAASRAHLTRKPAVQDGKPPTNSQRQAFEDIVWALVNTKEFLFNH